MTLWAILGKTIYNSDAIFVVQDPFCILPSNIAPYMRPFVMIAAICFANTLVHLSYFGIKKVVKVRRV